MGQFIYNTIMFIVNFVFFLVGAAVMSFGIVLLANPGLMESALNSVTGYQDINYIIDLNSALSASGILLTVVGSVIMCISLIGLFTCCCGGSCLYIIYAIFLGLIIAAEVAIIIVLSLNYTNMQSDVQKYMYTALTQNFAPVQISAGGITYSTDSGPAAWENMQFKYGCCGANGPQDFKSFTTWKTGFTYNTAAVYPPSCCMQIVQYQLPNFTSQLAGLDDCILSTPITLNYLNTKGCSVAVMEVVSQYSYITNIIIVSLIALEVIILQLTVHQYYVVQREKVGGYA